MALLQLFLSILDLLGVALIGIVATIAINGIGSNGPTGTIEKILVLLGISDFSFQSQTAILGISAVLVMVPPVAFGVPVPV